ncbi:MAG TPA: hypothetical protein VIL69_11245 [Roseomonas sp.]|jgi:hypothetical protein
MKYKNLWFVLGEKRGRGGSALLRGEQLAAIVTPLLKHYDVSVDICKGVQKPISSAVIVNKTALLDHGLDGLHTLRANGNRIFVDPVDGPMAVLDWKLADGVITSSIGQDGYFRQQFAHLPVVYVPHHADTRLTSFRCESEAWKCAYVGDPLNGMYLRELEQAGLLSIIDATNRNGAWMTELPQFSFHYAVRPPEKRAGLFKPFTKGAVAAECNALILAERRDIEAVAHLGENYPFLIDAEEGIQSAEAMLRWAMCPEAESARHAAALVMERLRQSTSAACIREIFRKDLIESGLLLN